jgi:hypothetical protein
MPLYEPPPRPSNVSVAAFVLVALVGLGAQVLAGFIYLFGFIIVAVRPEDQVTLDLNRAALGVIWGVLGVGFLIGWYFKRPWTLTLPFVALAAIWFGLQLVPGHAPIW